MPLAFSLVTNASLAPPPSQLFGSSVEGQPNEVSKEPPVVGKLVAAAVTPAR